MNAYHTKFNISMLLKVHIFILVKMWALFSHF